MPLTLTPQSNISLRLSQAASPKPGNNLDLGERTTMTAPLPPNEAARLDALQEYQILDTPPEAAFERITRLAAHIFQVPIALVTLLDERRQWFKSCYGFNIQEVSRDLTLCAHTMLQPEALAVPDMQLDARFADHPLVTQEPHLRFYAGAPLRTSKGFNLGTVCILDTVPHQLTAAAVASLTDLAALVVDELELRLTSIKMRAEIADREQVERELRQTQGELEARVTARTGELTAANVALRAEVSERQQAAAALRAAEARYRGIFENAVEGIFQTTPEGHYRSANPALARIYGYATPDDLIANLTDIERQLYVVPTRRAEFRRAINEAGVVYGFESEIRRRDGSVVWISENAHVARDPQGNILYYEGMVEDISERKGAEAALQKAQAELELRVAERTAELAHTNAALRQEIAERQRIEAVQARLLAAVESQRQRLDDTLANLPGMVWEASFDPATQQQQVQFVSEYAEAMLGYSREEWYSNPDFWLATMHPEDRARVSAQPDSANGEQSETRQYRVIAKDGRVLWVESHLVFHRDATGAPQVIRGVTMDISTRQAAENALRQSEERYSNLFHNQHTVMLLIDPVTQDIVDANPAASQFYGYSQAALLGKNLGDLNLLAGDELTGALQQAQDGQGKFVRRHQRANGELRDVEIYSGPLKVDGKPLIYSIILDITERKQAEERLRLLESVAVNANDAILITEAEPTDLPGPRILYANEAFTRNTGYSFDEVRGQTPRMFQGPNSERGALDKIRAALKKWEPVVAEVLNYRKDGSEFWVQLNIVPVANESGWFTHWVSVQRDITEEKRVAASLRLAKEEAERANRAKSEFLSRMSHELRTPLNAILGFTQLLAMDERPVQEQENLDYILKAGEHLLALINEVLDITRIEAGHLALSLEPVEVQQALQEVQALIRPLAQQNSIVLEEPEACEHHVLADRQRLKQVLLNLMANAVKYNQAGGRVSLSCAIAEPDRLHIKVSDTGLGIAPENMEQLFVPFDRLGAERTAIEGTGIGLALSKALVEAMGGQLMVSSVVGQGSVFSIELPLVVGLELPSPLPVVATAMPDTAPATVLYIEDNLPNLHLIERILQQRSGVRLLTALQGSLGLELARQHQPQVILLDLHLPDMEGDEVLQRLQADPATRNIPVIVLSADATPGRVQRLYEAGVQSYLTKPLQVQNFLLVLEETLQAVPATRVTPV